MAVKFVTVLLYQMVYCCIHGSIATEIGIIGKSRSPVQHKISSCFPLLTEVWDGLPGLPYSRVLQACAELCDSTTTQVSKLKHVFGSPQDMQIDFALRTVDTNHLVTQRIRLQDSQRSNQLSVSKTSYPRLDLQ